MYQAQFYATDDADWAQAIELFDNTTSQPLEEATDADFYFAISDCGSSVLSASFVDGVGTMMTKPNDYTIQITIPAASMASLCPGKTYDIGLTMVTNTGKTQILVGSLAILDGGF